MPDISQDEFEAKLPHLAPATAAELRQRANSGGSRSAARKPGAATNQPTAADTAVAKPAYGYKREISHRYVCPRGVVGPFSLGDLCSTAGDLEDGGCSGSRPLPTDPLNH
uniref:Uncharacterized protein n=1 Tax=Anopheles coluzzii TaxID=1518534 RepID=A0A8W7P3E0_ANOCL